MMTILLMFIYGIRLSCAFFTNPCDQTGLENNEGKCVEYDCGGPWRVHYYVCCNNWDDIPPIPPVCDKETYDSASDGDYCGTKGGNKGGGCRNSELFDCCDCALQKWIAARCHSRLNGINAINAIPGFCWHFTSCFERECKFWAPIYKIFTINIWTLFNISWTLFNISWTHFVADSGIDYSCGDGICAQDENITNCPMDCCSSMNSQCYFDPNVVAARHCEIEINDDNQCCGASCCGDSECCFDGITPTFEPTFEPTLEPAFEPTLEPAFEPTFNDTSFTYLQWNSFMQNKDAVTISILVIVVLFIGCVICLGYVGWNKHKHKYHAVDNCDTHL